jgi:hypothetical protein
MQDKEAQKMKANQLWFFMGSDEEPGDCAWCEDKFCAYQGLATIENDEVIATEFVCRKCALAYSMERIKALNTNKDDYRS